MYAFDIETGPLPKDVVLAQFDPKKVALGNTKDPVKVEAKIAEARQKHLDKAALSPATGKVLAVGWKPLDAATGPAFIIGETRLFPGEPIQSPDQLPDEKENLERFWEFASVAIEEDRQLVGFNIFGFDIPFLATRSWVNDVKVPDFVFDAHNYPNPYYFIDLAVVYQCGNRQRTITQDGLAKMLGVGCKTKGMNGGDFAGLWLGTPEEHEQAAAYAINDVLLIANCADKMQIF
jgi:hypothetical protein